MITKQKLGQNGFHVIFIILTIVLIGAIGFAGFRVLGHKNSKYGYAWDFNPNNNTWHKVGEVADCPVQVLNNAPADLSQATSFVWPGQYRGTNYKPHGNIRFDNNKTGDVTVKLPFDARLVGATKYQQTGDSGTSDTQYLMAFENACGFIVMFDHLYELDPEFTDVAEKGATTGESNTEGRFLNKDEKKFYKAGTVVATKTGFIKDSNTMFDFGVYDLRKPNEISKNEKWATIHKMFAAQTFYATCWIDLLPEADKDRIMQIMPSGRGDTNISDYCSYAPDGGTLNYNNGQPVNANTQNTQAPKPN